MSTFKRAKVVMLSTAYYKKAPIQEFGHFLRAPKDHVDERLAYYHHLYIITDDVVNIDDYVLHPTKDSRKEAVISKHKFGVSSGKKIVASTDKSLGLPEPSIKFINKYCEYSGINEIKLEYNDSDQPKIKNGFVAISKIKSQYSAKEINELQSINNVLIKKFKKILETKKFDGEYSKGYTAGYVNGLVFINNQLKQLQNDEQLNESINDLILDFL